MGQDISRNCIPQDARVNRTVTVDILSAIKDIVGDDMTLKKDLNPGEILCPVCKGTGVFPIISPYGSQPIASMTHKGHKVEAFGPCTICFAGVVSVCEHCGKVLSRTQNVCDCAGAKTERLKKDIQAQDRAFENAATELIPESLGDKLDYCAFENLQTGETVFFQEWDEFFNYWDTHKYLSGEDYRPEFVWGTALDSIKLDAESAIEMAFEEHDIDPDEYVTDSEKKALQAHMDAWAANEIADGSFYDIDSTIKVRIPWEKAGG